MPFCIEALYQSSTESVYESMAQSFLFAKKIQICKCNMYYECPATKYTNSECSRKTFSVSHVTPYCNVTCRGTCIPCKLKMSYYLCLGGRSPEVYGSRRVCESVRLSVRLSVRPSVRLYFQVTFLHNA